ncbi:acyltransferase family protein [Verrucomicrobia bacterium]|nr:acyltransferase family protein [Verrucomicrobiota bacterium]MDB4664844.1 acyltransferase family protein [Verrucomicrobiota bacterium]MDG1893235.1 acyltransferase family protein [Verrucomicrobiota bacterium]
MRYHGLDLVRSAAMLLGLSVHVNIFSFSENRLFWSAGEYHGDPINEFIANFIFQFRMPLFYMLAGFFGLLVIERKGMAFITLDRLKRIVLPFVVGVMLLVPLLSMLWCVNTGYENFYVGMNPWERVTNIIFWGFFSNQDISFQLPLLHYWFLYFLLILYTVHFSFRYLRLHLLGVMKWNLDGFFQRTVCNPWGICLLPLAFFPIRYSLNRPSIGLNQIDFDINSLLLYGAYYLFGVLLYKNRRCLDQISANCWLYAAMALPVCIYIIEPTWRMEDSGSVIVDITNWKLSGFSIWQEGVFHSGWLKVMIVYLRDFSCFALCFSFIGLAHRYLNTSSVYVRYLTDASYWAYWVHLLFTFTIARYLQQFEALNSLTKSYLTLVIAVFMVFWSYNAFVRYSFLGDFFMGKRKQREDQLEHHFRTLKLVKISIRPVVLTGVGVLLLGSLFHQVSLTQKGHIIVESYVARNQALLDGTATFDHIYDLFGNTPLHAAVKMKEEWRRYDPLPILISKTTDLNVQNIHGRTPIFEAVRKGNINDVNFLIDAGADLNLSDKYGHTPAHVAAIKVGLRNSKVSDHYFKLLTLLQEKGANLGLRDYKGRDVEECLRHFGERVIRQAGKMASEPLMPTRQIETFTD